MRPGHYFASPLRSDQHSRTSRASSYQKGKKRKRGDNEGEDGDVEKGEQSRNGGSTSILLSGVESFATLSAGDADQYRAAGFVPNSNLPPAPFPHAPASYSREKIPQSDIPKELASLKPPLYATSPHASDATPSETSNLRQKHISVITTLLHHCLLKRDYFRAGRAWGMILRAEFSGRAIDVRNHGRWGIGAEILLQRHSSKLSLLNRGSTINRPEDAESVTSSEAVEGMLSETIFTQEGFKAARDYYERLILQYPQLKTHPHAVSATTFYPAMFSVWIYEVCENSRQARERLSSASVSPENGSTDDEDNDDSSLISTDRRSERLAQLQEIRSEELRRALEIAARLDELLLNPPYDRHADLLQMRGMVALWIGDLLVKEMPPPDSASGEDEPAGGMADFLAESDVQRSLRDKKQEVNKAASFFMRAKANGGRIWEGVERLVESGQFQQPTATLSTFSEENPSP